MNASAEIKDQDGTLELLSSIRERRILFTSPETQRRWGYYLSPVESIMRPKT